MKDVIECMNELRNVLQKKKDIKCELSAFFNQHNETYRFDLVF